MKAPARQRGAALLVVLSLVAIASVVAMAGVKSALVDERLAGNMRAMAQAQMAADWGGADRLSETPESSELLECVEIQDRAEQGALSADWSDVHTLTNSDTVGYRHIDCIEQDVVVQLIMGQVSDGEQVLARHFLMVGREESGGGAGVELPDVVPEDCKAYGGQVSASPGLDQPEHCENNVPYWDLSPSDYVSNVGDSFAEEDFGPDGCASEAGVVFCSPEHGFDGNLDLSDYHDADEVVVDGKLTLDIPKGSYDTSVTASGSLQVNVHGSVELNGDLWAGLMRVDGAGSLVVNGTLVARGNIDIHGKIEINPDEGGEDDGGVIWIDRDD
ncbi:hypothetical protein DYI26_17620 [Halomonas litopenaei]|nr:hypothetical protein [Halomonas litopenaei]